jgi:hypothetical protein
MNEYRFLNWKKDHSSFSSISALPGGALVRPSYGCNILRPSCHPSNLQNPVWFSLRMEQESKAEMQVWNCDSCPSTMWSENTSATSSTARASEYRMAGGIDWLPSCKTFRPRCDYKMQHWMIKLQHTVPQQINCTFDIQNISQSMREVMSHASGNIMTFCICPVTARATTLPPLLLLQHACTAWMVARHQLSTSCSALAGPPLFSTKPIHVQSNP